MSTREKMKSQICYASLAIYSTHKLEEKISEALRTPPSITGERAGNFSWIYSTQNALTDKGVEHHLELLRHHFGDSTQELIRLAREGCEIRLWVYFGAEEINSSFVLEAKLLAWLSSFDADVCVDVWN